MNLINYVKCGIIKDVGIIIKVLQKERIIPMADLNLIPYDKDGKLHLINWRLVVSSDDRIGDIQKWLDEIENIDASIMTVFTPRAMAEFYNMHAFLDHINRMEIGGYFCYNGYKVTKVTESICAVEETK